MVGSLKCCRKKKQTVESPVYDEDEVLTLYEERILVNRRLYNQTEFKKSFPASAYVGFSVWSFLQIFLGKHMKPGDKCAKKTLYNRIPSIKWLKKYKREDFLPDFFAGITVFKQILFVENIEIFLKFNILY